jgi:6-phosphogluconolactonase
MPSVCLSNDSDQLAAQAHCWLVETIQQHQSTTESPFTLALAGGSTPKALYKLLAKHSVESKIDWTRVVLLWGDERNVPVEHADSNYRMVLESLICSVPIPPENILAISNPGGDAGDAAADYEKTLKCRLPTNEDGLGVIDCVLLGMGDDVHTASLFPQTSALHESKRWVVANHVPKLNTWRITLTAPLINAAKRIAFLIAGTAKTTALRTLWHGPHDPILYPSQMIQPQAGELTFFVDRPALGEVLPPVHYRVSE